jgi:hypothetical protein
MAKKDEQAQAQEQIVPAPHPDAAQYALQPTSEKLNVDVVGDMPKDRFREEVLKGSDEAKSGAVDAHPPENQPA